MASISTPKQMKHKTFNLLVRVSRISRYKCICSPEPSSPSPYVTSLHKPLVIGHASFLTRAAR